MIRIIIVSLLMVVAFAAESQSWRYVRNEFTFGLGGSNFMGDLGGAKGIGTQGPKDFKIQPSRFATALGYRYMLIPEISLKGNLIWGYLSGDDALTKNVVRNTRNLSFRSMIGELSATVEFFPMGERVQPKYKIRGIYGNRTFSAVPFFYLGVGTTFFNPKAKYNGSWVALQPLGTEGQGLNGRPEKYKRYTLTFPIGMGLKYVIDRNWSVSLDMSVRYTTTDYIDDVSTSYYHLDQIEAAYGSDAAALSDRSVGPNGITGVNPLGDGRYNFLQRGDPTNKDSYMFAILTLHYRLRSGGTYIPKF